MEYRIRPPKKLSLNIRELWQYRELFYFFTWRDVKVKYKQTFLGFAWSVLQPFLMMVVFSIFFGMTLKVPSDNIPYPIFVYSGLLLWNVFSSGLTSASNSMVSNANIIKKIYFPRLIIPLSSILVAVFDFLMAFVVYAALLIYYKYSVSIPNLFFAVIIGLILTIVTTLGLGSFLAALNVKYRDFKYIVPFFIQMLLFLTPVIYPVSIFEANWVKWVLSLNPMSGAINIVRSTLIHSDFDWTLFSISVLSALCLFVAGVIYFRKTEAYFADIA